MYFKKEIIQLIIVSFSFIFVSCDAQSPRKNNAIIGGGCDGCELMYVEMPDNITSRDTSSGWTENVQKLEISGTVYQLGGKIPAPNVIIYYWHTDEKGYYSAKNTINELAKRHGQLRGWVKTDDTGKYSIFTSRPAPYPNNDIPAHIHLSIKEPNLKDEYYVDELVFDDDILLTKEKRKAVENRGGSGILKVIYESQNQVANHDLFLGLNIPNYPTSK